MVIRGAKYRLYIAFISSCLSVKFIYLSPNYYRRRIGSGFQITSHSSTMTTIRHFDAPHIVGYGKASSETGDTCILFGENGVGFNLDVQQADVQGQVPFEKQWLQLLQDIEQLPCDTEWMTRTVLFQMECVLPISFCHPARSSQELAPNSKKWKTLDDYIHTPTYRIRLLLTRRVFGSW